jgi:hypothetical protein
MSHPTGNGGRVPIKRGAVCPLHIQRTNASSPVLRLFTIYRCGCHNRVGFLYSVNAKLDLWLENSSDFNHSSSEQRPGRVQGTNDRPTLTVFSSPKGRGGQRACWIGHKERKDPTGHIESTTSHTVTLNDAEAWRVETTQTIKIPPRVKQIIVGKVALLKLQNPPKLVCVEPAQMPYEGILAARVLFPLLAIATMSGYTPVTSPCLRAEQPTTSTFTSCW